MINEFKRELEEEDQISMGSLSSADERDLQLLLSGEHTYYFQCLEIIKHYTRLKKA
jgi:hypothetical protein